MQHPSTFRSAQALGALVALSLISAGCDRRQPPTKDEATVTAPVSSPAASPGPVAPAATPVAVGSASSGGKQPATTRERAAYARYEAAMARGRLATQRKQWDRADKAFGAALQAVPHDPRALAERGYAKLLADDLDGAQRDFDAVRGTSDDDLFAQVWFNRGLVLERRGDAEAALEAFATSHSLKPTKAAAAKLGGRSSCPVGIVRLTGKVYASWMALWNEAIRPAWAKYNDPASEPKDDVSVRRELDATRCSPLCAARVSLDEDVYHVVVPKPDGTLLVFDDVFRTRVYRCGGGASVKVEPGPPVRVQFSTVNNEYTMFCDPGAPPGTPCMTGCVDGSWVQVIAAVDASNGRMLRLFQTGSVKEGEVEVPAVGWSERGAKVELPGCAKPVAIAP